MKIVESLRWSFCEIMKHSLLYSFLTSRSVDALERNDSPKIIDDVMNGNLHNAVVTLGKEMYHEFIKTDEAIDYKFRSALENNSFPLVRICTDAYNQMAPWELISYGIENILCLKAKTVRVFSITPEISDAFVLTGDVLVIGANPGNKFGEVGFGDWKELPRVEDECRRIKNLFLKSGTPVKVLFGDDGRNAATKSNVIRELERGTYQIIHFAGHSMFDYSDAKFSKLILEGTEVVASEILRIFDSMRDTLKPELFFLDACESGAAHKNTEIKPSDGVHGLAHAITQMISIQS